MIGPPGDVPVDLTGEEARRLAERELSDPAYRAAEPGIVERVVRRIVEWVVEIAERAGDAAPGGWLGILGLALLLLVVVLVVRWRVGPVARSARMAVTVDPGTSSEQYRARAGLLADQGRWAEAITARMRALARSCQEQGLIDTRAGWTADEIAAEVGRRHPAASQAVSRAARTFDEVRYGGRPGTSGSYAIVAAGDEAVTASRRVHG